MVGIKDFDMPSCCNICDHWSFNRDDEPLCDLTYEHIKQFDKRHDDCPLIEAIPKAEYETRLMADMVAILEELYMEIEELDNPLDYDFEGYDTCVVDCEKLIQQKINSLKESTDGME